MSRRQQPSKTRSARVSSEVLGGLSTSVRASVALMSGFFTAHLCGTNVCSNSTGTTALSHTRNTTKNTHFILLLLRLNLKQTPKAHCNARARISERERERERELLFPHRKRHKELISFFFSSHWFWSKTSKAHCNACVRVRDRERQRERSKPWSSW